MKKEEVIRAFCEVQSLVSESIGDYSVPADGFCDECFTTFPGWNFQNSGKSLDYIREATLLKLKADGFKIHERFDPATGKQKVTL